MPDYHVRGLAHASGSTLLVFLLLTGASAQSNEHPTGLTFLDDTVYSSLRKASSHVSGRRPDSVTLEYDFPPAQNQLNSNACASFAVTSNKAYRIYVASGRHGRPEDYLQSPGFPYSATSQRFPDARYPACGNGTYILENLKFMGEIGSLFIDRMPFRPNVCEAWQARIKDAGNASQLDNLEVLPRGNPDLALDLIRDFLAGGSPSIIGMSACREFQHPVKGYIGHLDASGEECGGHAVVVVGYDDRFGAVRILNSWGAGAAWQGSDDGKVWMSYSVFKQRFREGYVDFGPSAHPSFVGNYREYAEKTAPTSPSDHQTAWSSAPTSVGVVLTPEILKKALRSNVGAKTGKTVTGPDGKTFEVNERYLWLNLPNELQESVDHVVYQFIDEPTFPKKGYKIYRKNSSLLLAWWDGWDCVDRARVTAFSSNGASPVSVEFNYCALSPTSLEGKPSNVR